MRNLRMAVLLCGALICLNGCDQSASEASPEQQVRGQAGTSSTNRSNAPNEKTGERAKKARSKGGPASPEDRATSSGKTSRLWTRHLGTLKSEFINDSAVDGSGNVYVAGLTEGGLGGETNSGGFGDAFVAKYDASGARRWVKLLGSSVSDSADSVSVDESGNIYIAGSTKGDLGGQTNNGSYDAFVAKYDGSGTRRWVQLVGSTESDAARGVSVDAPGSIYVAGETKGDLGRETNNGRTDNFVAKYDPSATRRWVKLLGSSQIDSVSSVSVDGSGPVYVAGETKGKLGGKTNNGGKDAFVAKYDGSGTQRWVRLIGSAKHASADSVSVDQSGNIYVAGSTKGDLGGQTNNGSYDAFVAKYNGSGTRRWVELLGHSEYDSANSVSVDGSGHVYVAGETEGDLGGKTNSGALDTFVAVYDPSGTRRWVELLGSSERDRGQSVSVYGSGHVYVTGHTEGNLGGKTNNGQDDGFIASIPTP